MDINTKRVCGLHKLSGLLNPCIKKKNKKGKKKGDVQIFNILGVNQIRFTRL